jgi:protein JSN1
MDKAIAVRARDDVLNRLGGYVTELSETAPVRVGFGKIDSAPSGGSTSASASPPGLVSMDNTAGLVPSPAPWSTQETTEEQSPFPTRALWIGAIPATTSSTTLLQIFAPFGPVESAKVLTHKASLR